MSKVWPKFSKEHPCPACGHWDWSCRSGDISYICMRVQSDRPSSDGGWYHQWEDKKPKYIPQRREVVKTLDIAKEQSRFVTCGADLALSLGVSFSSLESLGVAWSPFYSAWSFPMSDGNGNVIGFRLRNESGKKWAIPGSRSGIFLSSNDPQKICYLPEGPTSTAALLTLGLYAIGRPSCNAGSDHIKTAIKRLGVRRVVIVADADEVKANGSRPGYEGALRLKKELAMPSVIWVPPYPIKDSRDFLIKGGTKQMIENDVNQKIWK